MLLKNSRGLLVWAALFLVVACVSAPLDQTKVQARLNQAFVDNKVSGVFALMSLDKSEPVLISDPTFYDKAFLPASTFKIANSLIALERGVLSDSSSVIPWDGNINAFVEKWNRDLSLNQAFKLSCVPCYKRISREIGRSSMQHGLNQLDYGNKKIGQNVDGFWLDNSLKISAKQQLHFLRKLYKRQLPVSKRIQDIVVSIMKQKEAPSHKLYYKTGWGEDLSKNQILWKVGWVEQENKPHFFVFMIKVNKPKMELSEVLSLREKITEDVFRSVGLAL